MRTSTGMRRLLPGERERPLVGEADDLNHAIQLLSKHPGLRMGPFEIRPIDEEFMARNDVEGGG